MPQPAVTALVSKRCCSDTSSASSETALTSQRLCSHTSAASHEIAFASQRRCSLVLFGVFEDHHLIFEDHHLSQGGVTEFCIAILSVGDRRPLLCDYTYDFTWTTTEWTNQPPSRRYSAIFRGALSPACTVANRKYSFFTARPGASSCRPSQASMLAADLIEVFFWQAFNLIGSVCIYCFWGTLCIAIE